MSKGYRVLCGDQLHPLRPVCSNFVTPLQLAIIRTVMSLFSVIAVLVKLIDNSNTPINYIMFLTNLSFYGLTIYLLVSTYFSWRYVRDPEFTPWAGSHWVTRLPYFLLYQASLLLSFIVTIVYWTLLAKEEFRGASSTKAYLSIAMHAFNFVFTVTEATLATNPVILIHLAIILPITLLYIPYAIIIHSSTGIWPYFFLNYVEHPKLFAGVLLGIFVAALVIHTLMWYLHKLRDGRASDKKFLVMTSIA